MQPAKASLPMKQKTIRVKAMAIIAAVIYDDTVTIVHVYSSYVASIHAHTFLSTKVIKINTRKIKPGLRA